MHTTLHEAMRSILSELPDQKGSTQYLSQEISKRKLNQQKSGGIAHPGQIRIRAIKYPHLFEMLDRDTVLLLKLDFLEHAK